MLRFARWTASGLLGLVACSSPCSVLKADDLLPAAAADDIAADPSDVTAQVRVHVTATLLSNREGALFTGVVVENTSAAEIAGPLVVVVDDTSIPHLTFAANDGDLSTGEHCVQVLAANGKLRVGGKTPSQRMEFTATERIPTAVRQTFAPQFRVLQAEPVAVADVPLAAHQPLPGKSYSQARLDALMAIQSQHTPRLLETPGVFGTAIAENEQGELVMTVFTQRHGIIKELPGQVGGVDLDQTVTGASFRAGPAWTKSIEINGQKTIGGLPQNTQPIAGPNAITYTPTDPTLRFERPVPIGVSLFDMSDRVCASGTLGCRIVFADGQQGILTNSHVGSREGIAAAVKEDVLNGNVGDQWSQPGCGDSLVALTSLDAIGTLVDFQTFSAGITTNLIDAAVARMNSQTLDLVSASTPADGYGTPSRTPVTAKLGTRVVKFGRTTGLRQGTIRGINAIVPVAYSSGIFTFSSQLVVYGDNAPFGMPGDSGSLIVTETGHHPVGLLFAGSGFQVLANPIQPVLSRFNIAIDDGSGTPPVSRGVRTDGRMGNSAGNVPNP